MPTDALAASRPFYSRVYWYFILAMAVTFAGFFESFFANLATTDAWHHIHGISATGWILLVIVQPWLYSRGKMPVHRKLGKLSFLLAPMLIFGGMKMVHTMVTRRDEYPPFEAYRLSFIDCYSLVAFIFLFSAALYHRRNLQYHARYMAATVVLLMPPGLTRFMKYVPGIDGLPMALQANFIVLDIVILLMLLDDKRRGGFSKPYLQLAAIMVLMHILMTYAGHWGWWQAWMNAFSG
jgi:hypothetical protein